MTSLLRFCSLTSDAPGPKSVPTAALSSLPTEEPSVTVRPRVDASNTRGPAYRCIVPSAPQVFLIVRGHRGFSRLPLYIPEVAG